MTDHAREDHPISVVPHAGRVVVRFAGEVVADSTAALRLDEADYPAVHYLPREAIRLSLLRPSARLSRCPYKGQASYWTLSAAGRQSVDAAWSYEQPLAAVAVIAGHLAFYTDRVDSIELD